MTLRRLTVGAVLVAALALVVATAGSARPSQGFKMAVVTDVGSLQDRGFNQLSNVGRLASQKELGIGTRVYVSSNAADRTPNLIKASRDGHKLVFGVGFLMFEGLNAVAPRFPNVQYAGIDVAYGLLSKKPKNVAGVIFAEHEAGYLVGYLAGLTVKRQGGEQVISAVGANKVPAIVRFISGYIQGAKKANPKVKVLANYANDPTFSDEAKCKETALNQIQQGSKVVFQVAGKCGLGALSAAKESKVWGIGVDADQRYLGSHMLTSALKKVDVAVEDLTRLANAGNLATGRDYTYSLKNKGVGLGSVSPKVPKVDVQKTRAVGVLIARGKIKVNPEIKF